MDIYHEQSKNVFRTWALMTIFFIVIIALGYIFAEVYDSAAILYFAIIFALFMNFFSYWYSDKITLSLYHAQQVKSQAESPLLWNAVENMAITAGLPMPKVYIVNDPAPNAFATGRNKNHAAIAVTSGLLAILNKTELEGVVAHEISHIGNRDILIGTIVVVLLGFVSILSNIFLRSMFLGGGRTRGGGNSEQSVLAIVGVVLAVFSPIALMLIQLAISRKREYLADASGALLTRYPEGLASALEKIRDYQRPMLHANQATAHLFIADPLKKSFGQKVSSLFDTHPPIDKRIAILEGMEGKVPTVVPSSAH